MKRVLAGLLLCLLAGCNAPAPVADANADLASVNQLREAYIAAFNANDAEALGNVYAEDAVTMGGNQPTLRGRAAIVESNRMMFDQFAASLAVTSEHNEVFGDDGYDRGTFSLELKPKDGRAPMTSQGRYLVLFRRQSDGSWKVTNDMDNSPTPPPDPAAK